MNFRHTPWLRGALPAAGLVAAFVTGAAQAQTSCDRTCLETAMGNYVAAMIKHDPSLVKFSADFKGSENEQPIKPGDGLWKTIDKVLSQPQFVADPATGQIGYIGVVDDAGKTAFLGLRLKIQNGEVTEAESIVSHDGESGPAFEPQGFIYREAPYIRDVPAPARTSAADLLNVANTYWTVATTTHDGSAVPYSLDCWHFENGMNTNWERDIMPNEVAQLNTAPYRPQADGRIWTCAREVYLTTAAWSDARDQHFIVDPDRGLVFNMVLVDTRNRAPAAGAKPSGPRRGGNPMAATSPIDGPGKAPLGMSRTGMMQVMGKSYTTDHFEVMRIVDGKITREQDVMHILPLNTPGVF